MGHIRWIYHLGSLHKAGKSDGVEQLESEFESAGAVRRCVSE